MAEKTWFKLYRGWQDSPMFRSDKDKLCWLWLLENAVVKEATVSISNKPVKINRGQLCYSIRFLAKAWGANPSYVRCFLKHLKKWHAIHTVNDTGQTLITICNYSRFQDKQSENDTGQHQDIARERHRNDTNTKNDKNDKKKEYNPPTPLPEFISNDLWERWEKHRKEIKKPLTKTQAEAQVKKLTDWHSEGMDVSAVIENSIAGGWQGLFKPKGETHDRDAMRRGFENA